MKPPIIPQNGKFAIKTTNWNEMTHRPHPRWRCRPWLRYSTKTWAQKAGTPTPTSSSERSWIWSSSKITDPDPDPAVHHLLLHRFFFTSCSSTFIIESIMHSTGSYLLAKANMISISNSSNAIKWNCLQSFDSLLVRLLNILIQGSSNLDPQCRVNSSVKRH